MNFSEDLQKFVTDIKNRLNADSDLEKCVPVLDPETITQRYSLKYKISKQAIIDKYVSEITQINNKYKSDVHNLNLFLSNNAYHTIKMDSLLRTNEDLSEPFVAAEIYDPLLRAKDGSTQLPCVIDDCKVTAYKLKRHILDKHPVMDQESVEYALYISKKIASNRNAAYSEDLLCESAIPKQRRFQNTQLVNRKKNYKKCSMCSGLYMNISDHILNTHKIKRTDQNYLHIIEQSLVVPKVFTKKVNGTTEELKGPELDDAKKKFDPAMQEQRKKLNNLKELREEIKILKQQMQECENQEIEAKIIDLEKEYKLCRYSDNSLLTEKLLQWKESYLSHLFERSHPDPKGAANKAFAVIIADKSIDISFEQLTDANVVSNLLKAFSTEEGRNYSSKIKYIKQFKIFLDFLLENIKSPERSPNETMENILRRKQKIKEVKQEIESQICVLSKKTGLDKIQSRRRARSKLLTKEEVSEVLISAEVPLIQLLRDKEANNMEDYTMAKIINVRDSLIAAGAVRIPTRSKEWTTMTLAEVENSKEIESNGEKLFLIEVADQKNTRNGKPAAVLFSKPCYQALQIYIQELRPKFNCESSVVFPPRKNIGQLGEDSKLKYSSIHQILAKFKCKSGKTASSRTLRGSRVTQSRIDSTSTEHHMDLAKAMNHTYTTSENSYNYNDLSNSVISALSHQPSTSQPSNSDQSSRISNLHNESLSLISEPEHASTPFKRKSLSDNNSINKRPKIDLPRKSSSNKPDDLEETLKTLRNKKIKKGKTVDKKKVLAAVKTVVSKAKISGGENKLKTSAGKYSAKLILQFISEDNALEGVTIKNLRDILKNVEDNP